MAKSKKIQEEITNFNTGNGRKRKKRSRFRIAMKIFFLLILLGILAGMIVFYEKFGDDLIQWQKEAKAAVDASGEDTFRATETGFIYASNKKAIAKLVKDKDAYYITFDEIPQYVKDCFIVTEDRDFYEHDGVNFLSTAKAAFLYVESKLKHSGIRRGGSTITQQLARKIYLYDDQTTERKVREMFYAIELEKKYTKDQILEFYINNIYFANGKYGIESAAKAYFSKSSSELSLAETAFLCSIPNRPGYYDPLVESGYTHTNERKVRILDQLLSQNKITEAEYTDATYQEIILNPAQAIKTQDYMTTYAVRCAVKTLMELQGFEFKYKFKTEKSRKKYDKEYDEVYQECYNNLYSGGYRVYTSLSKSKQSKLQKSINENLKPFTSKTKSGVYEMQGAGTIIDNATGYVVAIVGGRKQSVNDGYTLNRAFQSYRQPGSCFKPLVVYTPALERDYTPDSIVDDSRMSDGPKNSDNTYLGHITLRRAVEKSKNVVAWRLFKEITPKAGLEYVLNMNFNKISKNDYYPAASLGGLTNGVTTTEMASAYSTIENKGGFREPTCIKEITDADGNVIFKNDDENRSAKQVYKEEAAVNMTDILEGVLVRGTAAGKGIDNMHCAGKTGTTSDKKDGWFCGFTPYYTCSIWVGYDNPKPVDDLYGNTYPLTIWRDIMTQIHEGLEDKEFPQIEEEEEKKEQKDSDDGESSRSTNDREDPEVNTRVTENDDEEAGNGESADNGETQNDVQVENNTNNQENNETVTATKKPKATKKPTVDEDYDNGDLADETMDVGEDDYVEDVGE